MPSTSLPPLPPADVPASAPAPANTPSWTVNEEVNQAAYAMSHDVLAPLLTIQGFAAVLKTKALDDEGQQLLARISANARVAGDRVHALADYLRVLTFDARFVTLDMTTLAQQAAEAIGRETDSRTPVVDIEPLAPAAGDRELVQTLLRHLLINAATFSRLAPSPRIRVSCSPRPSAPVYAVSDNGVGFEQSRAPKLFSPFRRLHRESEYPGLGMGLAIARLIVQRHQGQIWCQAEPGRGAAFFFTLGSSSPYPA